MENDEPLIIDPGSSTLLDDLLDVVDEVAGNITISGLESFGRYEEIARHCNNMMAAIKTDMVRMGEEF